MAIYDPNQPKTKKPTYPPAKPPHPAPIGGIVVPEESRPTWRVGTNSYFITLEQIIRRHLIQTELFIGMESPSSPGYYTQYRQRVIEWLTSMNQSRFMSMQHTEEGVKALWEEIRRDDHITNFVMRITQEFYLSDLFAEEGAIAAFIRRVLLSQAVTQSTLILTHDEPIRRLFSEVNLEDLYRTNRWFLVLVLLDSVNLSGILVG